MQRKKKCYCGLTLLLNGLCRASCHLYKKPARAVRAAQGRSPEAARKAAAHARRVCGAAQ